VDDGSKDRTWELIQSYHRDYPHSRGLKLSTNFGHQNALMAGMMSLKEEVDCIVSIDADLQDDITVIEQMVDAHAQGFSVVYGVRKDRSSDTFFKRFTAQFFYKMMIWMKVKTVYNHADFRLLDRRVLLALAQFDEVNLFLRGMFPIIGFRSTEVFYSRKERLAGETKYPLRKMLAFAWNGITSFSTFPLRLIFNLGLLIFFLSIFLTIWAFIPVFTGNAVHGWASTVIPIFVFAGVQMISLGLIGEYVGKIYAEVKKRPRFFIEEKLEDKP
jgi:glycosyltransferase involved in cell wall biosynthesis